MMKKCMEMSKECKDSHSSDQYVISPYFVNTLSTGQVMRIKKIINWVILFDETPNSVN